MYNTYNANMYLTPSYLNNIENEIELLTNDIQEEVFNNQQSSLKNIDINDNLNEKILYLSFPRNSYEEINNSTNIDIITTDNNNKIAYQYINYTCCIYLYYKNVKYNIYAKRDDDINPYLNYVRFNLPQDFGIVTQIDSNDNLYQYINIYENEDIIPNYIKNNYNISDIPTMRQIDNLERGIYNIGHYYYKPLGFINCRTWFGTANLNKDNDNNVGMKNISYQDLNRWVNNLELINFDDLNKLNIWNSNISQLVWNEFYDGEWEDL